MFQIQRSVDLFNNVCMCIFFLANYHFPWDNEGIWRHNQSFLEYWSEYNKMSSHKTKTPNYCFPSLTYSHIHVYPKHLAIFSKISVITCIEVFNGMPLPGWKLMSFLTWRTAHHKLERLHQNSRNEEKSNQQSSNMRWKAKTARQLNLTAEIDKMASKHHYITNFHKGFMWCQI